jgi:pseudouridine-5'-phosphate glycosidase
VESAEEAASIARAHWDLGGAGLLLGNAPQNGVDVEPLLEQALRTAAAEDITGQAVTPFVLSYLHEQSGGRTLEVNRDLVVANAGLAARVAASPASSPQ